MKKFLSRIAIIAVVVFVVYNFISLFTKTEQTIVAEVQTIEISYNFDGVVSRSEKVVSTSMSGTGWFEPSVSEGEMIKNGKLLGVYYEGEIDAETKARLNDINAAIDDLTMSSDELNMLELGEDRINNDIAEKKQGILDAAQQRDVTGVKLLKNELLILMDKKEKLLNEDDSSSVTIEELESEKSSIENSKKIKKEEIYAPCHGVFTTNTDGFEAMLNSKTAMDMTVDDFEAFQKKRGESSGTGEDVCVCKIVDNSQWWVSLLASETEAKNFKIGETVRIRIAGETNDIEATVQYISPAKGDNYILTLSSNFGSDYAMKNRFMNVTVVKESYTGLQVPISAIRVKDGKTGVYVKADSTKKFRETDIIYKDDKIAIVRLNTLSMATSSLLLYDEVYIN